MEEKEIKVTPPVAVNIFPIIGFGIGLAVGLMRKSKNKDMDINEVVAYPILGLALGFIPRLYYENIAAKNHMQEKEKALEDGIDKEIKECIDLLAIQNMSSEMWKQRRSMFLGALKSLNETDKRLLLEILMAVSSLPEEISNDVRITFTDKMEVLESKYGVERFKRVGDTLNYINQIISINNETKKAKEIQQQPAPESDEEINNYKEELSKIKPNDGAKEDELYSLILEQAVVPNTIAA